MNNTVSDIMKLADAYAEANRAYPSNVVGGVDRGDTRAALEAAVEQLEKDAYYEYERGYQQGLSAGRVYKEEARAYKEAFYKLCEQLAKGEALKPQVPIVIMNPVGIDKAMEAK